MLLEAAVPAADRAQLGIFCRSAGKICVPTERGKSVSAYAGKVGTPMSGLPDIGRFKVRKSETSDLRVSGLPDIGALKCANRKHPICVFFRKGYAQTHESEAHPVPSERNALQRSGG